MGSEVAFGPRTVRVAAVHPASPAQLACARTRALRNRWLWSSTPSLAGCADCDAVVAASVAVRGRGGGDDGQPDAR